MLAYSSDLDLGRHNRAQTQSVVFSLNSDIITSDTMESYTGRAHQRTCYLLNIPAEIRFIIYENVVPRQLERFLDLRIRPLSNQVGELS